MRRLVLVLAIVVAASNAAAQPLTKDLASRMPDAPALQTYGTADEAVVVVAAPAFSPYAGSITWELVSYLRYVTSGSGCCLQAPVHLPAGAQITAVSFEGCDYAAGGRIVGLLVGCATPGAACSPLGTVSTGIAAMPGCVSIRSGDISHTVNNAAFSYWLEYSNDGVTNGSVAVRAARVHYKLQVSSPPVTPTFTDVPATHPFYQFIEALAAAGVTGGCIASPLQYCPDAPITRGQMAVFMSRALGLHWTP